MDSISQHFSVDFGSVRQSRSQEFENGGGGEGDRGNFRQMYRQDVSNVPRNTTGKSK